MLRYICSKVDNTSKWENQLEFVSVEKMELRGLA